MAADIGGMDADGEGWGDSDLVLDEGISRYSVLHFYCLLFCIGLLPNFQFLVDAGFGDPEEKLEIDEEGGGWDVGDDDLELPADLVSITSDYLVLIVNKTQSTRILRMHIHKWKEHKSART